jgi:uncharacterized protein (DUF1697 family)
VTTRIAFLRAVNLGKRRVAMSHLVDIFDDAGYAGAWTYINSGNVVFEATGARAGLEQRLGSALEDALGFEVTTFVRTASELRQAVAASPFTVSSGDTYFLTFLASTLTASQRRTLEGFSNDFDTLVVTGRTVHWRMRGKSIDTTVRTKDWESVVGRHRSTSRTMTMIRKLLRKIDS